MRASFHVTALSSVLIALAGCSTAGEPDDPVVDPAEAALVATTNGGDGVTYFSVAADLRKCAFPMCGGWFVSRLNHALTQCPDGRWAAACYTPVLDWSLADVSEAEQARLLAACTEGALSGGVYAILRGQLVPTRPTPRGELGRFMIREAWIAEGEALSDGAFVRLQDNGLRCFVAPCPSMTETTLNTLRSADIAWIDWTPSGLTETQIAECTAEMAEPDGILVAGYRYTATENGTTAMGRTATAAYQRLSK